ncbi:MAG: SoxR reducing system RseC family protein [Clostridia bacterium]|nr:SoxR reducing system RseC family protein [Clostridia bacterium]
MRQRAVVLKTEGKIAEIEVSRASMCEGCEKNGGCGGHCDITGLVSSGGKMKAKAYNTIGAQPGDRVEVETDSRRVLGYAALVFLVPIVVCALFYTAVFALTESSGWSVLSAALGFALTFCGIALFDRKIAKRTPEIVIVSRLKD